MQESLTVVIPGAGKGVPEAAMQGRMQSSIEFNR